MNSPYDQQVPSTSFASNARPHTPLAPNRFQPAQMPGSPFRVSNADPVQKLRESCGIRNLSHFNQWMSDSPSCMYGAQAGEGSRPGSVAPSVVSGMSQMSQMSLGQMSELSVNTQITEVAQFNYAAPQMTGVSMSSASSSVENYYPGYLTQLDSHMDLLLRTLGSNDMVQRKKATNSIVDMVNHQRFRHANPQKMARLLIQIFDVIGDDNTDVEVMTQLLKVVCLMNEDPAMEAVIMNGRGKEPVQNICRRLIANQPYTQNALTAIWLMLASKRRDRMTLSRIRRYARSEAVIERLMDIASVNDLNYTVKALAISTVRVLIQSNQPMKEFFFSGMGRLLPFLNAGMEEKVISATAKLFLCLISSEAKKFAERFIELGGVTAMSSLLAHGSPRVLNDCLHCLSSVSDVQYLRQLDISQPILSVIQLLGADDPRIAEHGFGFLLNVAANNPRNKKIITEARGPSVILSVLSMLDTYAKYPLPNLLKVLEKIIENGLICLVNLTVGGDDAWILNARQQIAQHSPWFLLNTLASKRVFRSKVLVILSRIFSSVPEYVCKFIDMQDSKHHQNLSTIVLQLVFDLIRQFGNFGPAADENSLRTKQYTVDLLLKSLKVLCQITANTEIASQIANTLNNERLNPLQFLTLLRMYREEDRGYLLSIRVLMLRFIDQLTSDASRHSLIINWTQDRTCAAIIEEAVVYEGDKETKMFAQSLLSRVGVTSATENQESMITMNLEDAMYPEHML